MANLRKKSISLNQFECFNKSTRFTNNLYPHKFASCRNGEMDLFGFHADQHYTRCNTSLQIQNTKTPKTNFDTICNVKNHRCPIYEKDLLRLFLFLLEGCQSALVLYKNTLCHDSECLQAVSLLSWCLGLSVAALCTIQYCSINNYLDNDQTLDLGFRNITQ